MRLILAILLLLLPTIAVARTVTLIWDASPSVGVTGYKIYYQAAPYVAGQWDGTSATEGNSPLDVGNVLTYQLNDLPDGTVYCFGASAYDGSAESGLSNIVNSNGVGDSILHFGGNSHMLNIGSGGSTINFN